MSERLPVWVTKKHVSADAIKFIGHEGETSLLYLACGHVIHMSSDLMLEAKPEIGDYYVVTGHDQASIWPKAEFERDHTRISN